MFAFICCKNCGTFVLMSGGSSSDTVTKSRPRRRYSLSIFTRSGNSSRQGSHHVAQKLTRRGLSDSRFNKAMRPSVLISETTGGGVGRRGFAGGAVLFWAGAAKLESKRLKPTESMNSARGKRID